MKPRKPVLAYERRTKRAPSFGVPPVRHAIGTLLLLTGLVSFILAPSLSVAAKAVKPKVDAQGKLVLDAAGKMMWVEDPSQQWRYEWQMWVGFGVAAAFGLAGLTCICCRQRRRG